MDVHQFALLARQPSAALTERQHFWGMPKRGLALILANALFWQPLLVQAEGIAVSGTGTTLGQAGNGVPIVNIATPNASGLSHNQFQQYNVDSQGVILNNSTNQTQSTQLGGIIVGNSNLRGTAANTILNEVVGANASQLRGYTEVAGQAARVIVANPYGISCNGCGFINTPQVTLTTGKPILDANGQLQRFNVQGGSISIDGVGLNADNVDQFDIITRSAKINAELHAKRLNIITGRNDVDAQTLNPTALADDGSSKPELAIDSSALGGMYAGAIRLVGTEAGVGVRLAGDLAASGGDIQIDANGHLNVMQVAASGAVNVRANTAEVNGPVYAGSSLAMTTGGDLTTRQNVAARDALTLSAGGQLRNSAVIEAGVNADNSRNASGDVTLSANDLTNSGSITASRALQATVTQTLSNQGATLNGQASAWVAAGVIDNRQSGRILSQGGNADINASQVLNAQSGLISSSGNLNITAQTLDNSQQGKLSSGAVLTARISGQVLNQLGIINSAGGLLLNTGTVDNRTGEISSLGNLTATLVQFDNSSSGRLLANGALQLTADTLNNQNAGSVSGQQNVQLTLGQLTNTGKGSVYARNNLGVTATRAVNNDQGVLRSDGPLNLSAASLANSGGSVTSAGTASITTTAAVVNQGGQMLSDASLTLTSGSLDNSQSGRIAANGVTVTTGAFDNHKDGRLTSTGTLGLTAAQVNNTEAGRIASAMALTAMVTGLDQTSDGRLYSNSDVSLDLNNGVLNNQDGLINAPGQLLLKNLNVVNNRSGEISSANGFSLAATSLDNTEGSVLSNQLLIVRIDQLLTNLRGLVSGNGVDLRAATLLNHEAEISSLGELTATVGQFDNSEKGRLQANGKLLLTAGHLNNRNAGTVSGQRGVQLDLGQLTNTGSGRVYGKNSLGLNVTGVLNNDQGVVRSDGTLKLNAASLANTGGSITSAESALLTVTGDVVSQGGEILSSTDLTLDSASLDNSKNGRIAGKGVTVDTGAFNNQQGGRLTSTDVLDLTATQVNNGDAGRIAAAKALSANVTGLDQSNDGRLYGNSDVSLDLNNGVLNNLGGLITSPGQLLLKNLNTVTNQSGEISSANGFTLAATSLDNTGGSVISDKALIVRVAQLLTNLRGLISATGVELSAATLDNRNAELSSLADLTATVGQFDNSGKGRLLANGALLLDADSLNNQGAGAISGQQSVRLKLGQLANSASGSVYAKNRLDLNVAGALDNDRGALRSDGELDMHAGSLGNTAGSITSSGVSVMVVDGALVNRGGQILSDVNLSLSSGSLDNSQSGRIAGNGVKLATGTFDNRQGGRLTSTGTLQLDAGQVNNSDAGRIASAMALTAVVTGLDQSNDGRLYSNQDVSLDLSNGALNNQGGLIIAPGQLLLKNLTSVNNQNGEISSANGFMLAATSLDNTGGSVLSDEALVVRVDKLLTNLRGLVSGNGIDIAAGEMNNDSGSVSSDADLLVNITGKLSSRNGEVTSAGSTRLNALSIDNAAGQIMADQFLKLVITESIDSRAGTLGAGKGLEISAASLDNRQSGALVTDGQLTVDLSGALDNSAGGSLQAKGLMYLSSKALDNRGGRIAAQNLLMIRSDGVDNRGGSIRAEKGMQLFVGALDNSQTGLSADQKGVIFSNADLELVGARLDNQSGLLNAAGLMQLQVDSVLNGKGRIASQADLAAKIGSLTQQGGELVAQGNLSLTGDSLDNRSGGLVGSTKALKINVTDIDNRAGELSSQVGVNIVGQALNNSDGGKVLAGTALGLKVARVINLNKGLLFGNTLRLEATRLDNVGGTLASQQDMNIDVSGALDNTSGLLSSESALTINAASLQNVSGSLSSADAMNVTTVGVLNNQSGSVTTDATLTLNSASLDNSRAGKIAGKGATQVTTGTFDNSQGRLTSSDTLQLTAGKVINQNAGRIASALALTASVTSLDQQSGELFSNTSLSLDLNNGQLNNQGGLINAPGVLLLKNLKGVANQNGEISSAQAFTLNVDSLDNSGGKLLSSQALTLIVNKALSNVKGTISGATLKTSSASLDNTEGLISSRAGLDVAVDTTLTNVKGTLIGDGDVKLVAATVDNGLGQLASKQNLEAQIGSLQQLGGQMLAQGTLTLRGDTLDNRQNGFIGATKALDINVAHIDNRGGELSSQDTMTLTGQQLDNSDNGQILAKKAINLNVSQVINRANGLISGQDGLTLVGSRLDNTGGGINALKAISIDLSAALDNSQGLISSEDILALKASSLTNNAGSISSAGTLTLDSTGAIGNRGGRLVTDGALDLKSASLDNSQKGTISGKGLLTLRTGDFDNSQNGRVSSNNRLDLTTARLTNSNGGSIGSSQALTASVSRLDQQGGSLFSNTSLSLDLNSGQLNNQNGLINAPGALLLKNVNEVLNQNGEISSTQAFTLNAQQLDNSGGKLLSNQLLTLRIARALTNVKGMIAAAGVDTTANTLDNSGGTLTSRNNLDLTVTGALTNRDKGLINAAQALKMGAASVDNQSGQVLGGTSLILNTASINNAAKGLINSTGSLNLTAGSLESGNGGEVSAARDMTLVLNALSLNGGRLMSDAGLSIDMQGNDLNNVGGLITADGTLTLDRLRDLNNRSGEVSSAQSFTFNGRTLDNSSGKLISSNVLTVSATNLLNQNGLISGWQGLNVSGNRLDNRTNGTLSSRSGNVGVSLSGELLNGGNGALVSQNTLNVSADSLDNSGGILSSGTAQTLTVTGLLNNSQNGLIDSGAGLVIRANALSNASGNLTAQQDFSFEGRSIDNSAGSLSSKGAVTLDLLESLTNTNGKLASGGNLLLRRSTAINNQAGQLISQSLMTLNTSGQLDNRNRGTIAANNTLTVIANGSVLNDADGLIYSQGGNAGIQAASLSNARGTVQGAGALRVDVAGTVDNQNGRIIAQSGDLNLSGVDLYSQGGVLSSLQGLFTSNVTGVLKNGYDANRQGGVIQAQRLNLTALGGFDNYGGRVSARTGEALITTSGFDNRNGGLYAKGLVRVTGSNFDNSGDNDGQIAGGQVELNLSGALNNRFGIIESDSTLAVTAASLDNQTGQLRALGGGGATSFQIGNLFDNRNGTLESANTDLILNTASFLNGGGSLLHTGGGTFDISTPNVSGAGGSIVTRGGLTLNADSWSNSNVIQAGRLNVNVNNFSQTASGQLLASSSFAGTGGNWTNDGLIASDGAINLNIGGTYAGNGRLSSLGTLGLSAAQVNLNAATTISGGGDTTVTAGGQLNNAGRLTSASNLTVNAGGINNQGTLGSAQALTVTTGSLVNDRGLIFSGGNMSLRVSALNNSYADIYSLGNLTIDRNGQGALADSIVNSSATIQSDGSMSLAASTIQNIRAILTTSNGGIYTARIDEGACNRQFYNNDCSDDTQTHTWDIIQREKLEVTAASAASSITTGGNLNINGGDLLNQSSTIATSGNLTATLNNLTNTGVETSDTETMRSFRSMRTDNASAWVIAAKDFTDKYWSASSGYDANNLSGLEAAMADFIRLTETDLPEFHKVTQLSNGDQSYAAIIQAAGAVNVNASNNIGNNVVRAGYSYVSGGSRTDTNAPGSQFSTRITVNQQLPPDLAQQQVNPLSLPGFSLPTGQNGLFRLSGQTGTAASVAQPVGLPQSWTMSSAAVSVAQREQTVSDAQASTIQIGSVDQISSATRQIASVTRQSAGVSANTSAFDTSAPNASPVGGLVLPGHTSGSAGMTNVDSVTGVATSNQGSGALLLVQNAGATTGLPAVTAISSGSSATQNAGVVQGIQIAKAGQVTTDAQGNRIPANGPGLVANQVNTITPVAAAAAQIVQRVQGLPSSNSVSKPQKYLIETNPVLTDLRQFMSSDYLLAGLGYDPEVSAKRLGDGLYEQRLVQQAVVARTGQTFIDGQTSNEAQFKYLMNNAIASQQQLNLAVGVSLNSQQVAALTHDIVWLEEHEVNGEKVLVPVLYMAQADNRLGPNGALIAGNDLNLIAGQDLTNVGTLHATNNLSAIAGNDLVNSGLIAAGNRLDLLAGNDLINKAGGILYGRDVSLTAVRGDVINERTVTSHQSAANDATWRQDFADSAARIESANDLTINAGRDLKNTGGVLQAGRDISLVAGRDISIDSARTEEGQTNGVNHTDSSIKQLGSSVTAGRDLTAQAGRDISVIASNIDAKRDIAMAATENLTLSSAADEEHSYSKSKKVTEQEDHVKQVVTDLGAGGSVALSAGKDLSVIASRVSATDQAYLYAGNDVNLLAAQDSDYSYYSKTKKGSLGKKSSIMTESESESAVSSVIESGKKLVVSAGNDINSQGSKLDSAGVLSASAGRDINLGFAESSESESSASSKKGLFSSKSNASSSSQTTLTSTELRGESINLQADNDITLNAAVIYAQERAKLDAGRDVVINAAERQQSASQSSSSSKFSVNWVGAPSLAQKGKTGQENSSESVGSSISADKLDVISGRDTAIRGSTLVTDGDINIEAGRNVDIVSAQNKSDVASSSYGKKAGEIGSWWQSALGVVGIKESNGNEVTQQVGSQVASLGGNVKINAEEQYSQVASQVIAPKGDITIKAKDVDIEAGFDSLSANHTESSNRTAIGGSINVPLVDAVRGAQQAVESGARTDDARMQGLAAANAAMSAKQAYEGGQALMNGNLGVKVSVSLSNSQSHSESSQSGVNVIPSSVVAGGDVNIIATGAGKDSNIDIVGSRIDAGHDVNLKADGDVNLFSAQNTALQNSTNGNSGWSVGIGFSFGGTQNGITLDLAANKGKGKSDGADVTQTNTVVSAGNKASIESGGDTSLKGAVVKADQVQVTTGGDLNIESVQDTSKFASKQVDSSVGVSVCIPPFCYGLSGSASFNQQKMQSDYASVVEQSGIKAGDGGFQIDVRGNTGLVGGVIASTDQAVKDGKNTLATGTLTTANVKNKAEYEATSIGLSGGIGEHVGRDADGDQKAGAPGTPVANNGKVSANTPIALYAADDASSTTYSGISGATITIKDDAKQQVLTGQTAAQTVANVNTNVSSDRDGSAKLTPIFDADEIQTNFNIVGKFVQNTGVYLESRAQEVDQAKASAESERLESFNPALTPEQQQVHSDNYLALNQQARELANDWGAGGTYRQIATALVAGVSGNVTGASSQFAQNMVVNYVQQQGSGYIGKLVAAGDIREGDPIHTALHAILGCAGAAASSQSCSAGALGGAASSALAGLFNETSPNETNEEREAKRNIITSLVTGIAATTVSGGASAASNAAVANVDNNWLATQQIVQASKEFAAASNPVDQLAVIAKWAGISARQDFISGKGLLSGLTNGLAESGLTSLDSTVRLLAHPGESFAAMKEFVESTSGRQILGAASDALSLQLTKISTALQEGGDANAEQLGEAMGQAVSIVVSALAGGQTNIARAASELSKMGIDLSSTAIKTAAASYKASSLEKKLAKLESIGRDLDVPDAPEVPSLVKSTPHISGVAALQDLEKTLVSKGGFINASKLNSSSYSLTDLVGAEKQMLNEVISGADASNGGRITESLIDSIASRQGLQVLDGGKYGSNNGFDHVFVSQDGKVTLLLESKQVKNGTIQLTGNAAGGYVQMSDDWVDSVLNRLDPNSAAYRAVFTAKSNGTLVKGVAGVDRETGNVLMARLE
ncbi:hemagglutinin repeat-containing protein [Pseudomonas viridiflava]|uniref:hemagglutinin repeat-containing protein n=1 Tax=Pseudomonas viridiflava TaxID=33069 RepID=UPI001FD080FA|nr:hemagglutinin repeat-containing protein [Pseudomonas viridiflava]